jgi:hypothetical protein
MNARKLVKQLKQMGITKAVSSTGTSEGYPAVFLCWNGDEEVFTGSNEHDPSDPMSRRVERFQDSKLS